MISLVDFFQSILTGIAIAAVPGPVFFESMRRALTKGFWQGFLIVAGDFVGNLLLMCVIFLGVSQFITQPVVKIILYLCGSLILIYIAVVALKLNAKDVEQSYVKQDNVKNNSFWLGFLLATLNPIVISLWVPLTGYYLARSSSAFDAFFYVFFISVGLVCFFLPLVTIIHFTKRFISVKYVVILSKLFGFILFGYGLFLAYQLLIILIK